MIVKVVRRDRNVVAVTCRDTSGAWQGRIVPMTALTSIEGNTADVPVGQFDAGTEYGFDWGVAFPQPLSISGDDLTQALRLHGVWTLEDVLANSREVQAAILALTRIMMANIVRRARDCIVS